MDATISRSFIRSRYLAALALIFLGGVVVMALGYREVTAFRATFDRYHDAEELYHGVAATLVATNDRVSARFEELSRPGAALARRVAALEANLAAPELADAMPDAARAAFASFIGIARKVAQPVAGPEVDLSLHQSILYSIAETELEPQTAQIVAALGGARDIAWSRIETLACGALASLVLALIAAAMMIFRPMERHILEAQVLLERETARAQAAERSKGAFLANMSHEIRTALNGVTGVTELLARTRLDAGQAEYVGLMRASGAAVLRLINDVLDFSKIAAGEMTLENARFAPRQALVETARLAAPRIEARGVRLILDIDPALPRCAMGDAVRLRQIAANLLQNAAKFTASGRIELVAEWRAASRTMALSVADTGTGIPADKLDAIFGAFQQADNSLTPKSHGTGLGLAISRMLAERMGGAITVESVEGEGSRFTVTVPLGTVPEPAAPPPALSGRRVAVAVGCARLAQALTRTLRAAGADVIDAERTDGLGGGAPCAVVCEVGTRAWRAQAPDARIVALSPVGVTAPDADATLAEPVDPDALIAALTGRSAEAGAATAAQSFPGLRVLVAEDNDINQLIARRLLEDLGCTVEVVADGAEAVRATLATRPDIVLMDVSMPRMTGLEATNAIRRREAALDRRTPIVAMTAHAMEEHRERCLEAGMDDRLAKPFRPEDLAETLARWTAGAEDADGAAPAVGAA